MPRKTASAPPVERTKTAVQGIAALVNDDPITAFEVERRAAFMSLSGNFQDRAKANMKAIAENPATNERLKAILDETIKANPGKSREQVIAAFEERKKVYVISLQRQAVDNAKASLVPTYRKKALEELIEERLKFQEAKKLSIAIAEDDVERVFKSIADRNKMTSDQFAGHIRSQGADPTVMRDRFRAQLAWREVIKRRYGHQISVSNRDVDKFVANAGGPGEDLIELQLHKITLPFGTPIDQQGMAQRLREAEALRAKFGGCKGTASLAKTQPAATFEDLSFRKAGSIAEPTRSLLVSARDGEMAPASITAAGAELYAVCSRRTLKASDEKRQAAESELTLKEFDRLAQRHLNDLRKDALIELR